MTVWSARQVAGFWQSAGGAASRDVEWVAIALGESSFDDSVVSSAGAIGLWQIMPFNAAPWGFTPGDLSNPFINARIAVGMSGDGQNCAAWDSAYRDINASGRYSYLAFPEQGSADWNNIPAVANELGKNPNYTQGPGSAPAVSIEVDKAASRWQNIAHVQLPGLNRALLAQRVRLNRLYSN